MTDARTAFETRLPEIERLAGIHFRRLDPEARQEAVQNTSCWRVGTTRLVERGKQDEGSLHEHALVGMQAYQTGSPGRRERQGEMRAGLRPTPQERRGGP